MVTPQDELLFIYIFLIYYVSMSDICILSSNLIENYTLSPTVYKYLRYFTWVCLTEQEYTKYFPLIFSKLFGHICEFKTFGNKIDNKMEAL